MKTFVILSAFISLLFFSSAVAPSPSTARIIKWRDGDTATVFLYHCAETAHQRWQCGEIGVRIDGINTPEMGGKAKCPKEKNLAEQARSAIEKLAPIGSLVTLVNVHEGKYAGRILATMLNKDKVDIGGELLKRGLARSYHGEYRDPYQWCPQ